jgi:hypothetical protein
VEASSGIAIARFGTLRALADQILGH